MKILQTIGGCEMREQTLEEEVPVTKEAIEEYISQLLKEVTKHEQRLKRLNAVLRIARERHQKLRKDNYGTNA